MAIYHQNHRATRLRDSGFADSYKFAAASTGPTDNTAAETIAGHLNAALVSQEVSLTRRIYENLASGSYPAGSRLGFTALEVDTAGAIWRVRLRNRKATTTEDLIANLLAGTADTGGILTALTATPNLPNTGVAFDHATVTLINLGP